MILAAEKVQLNTTESIKLSRVTWKGVVLEVEYGLFTMLIRQWMESGWTKEQCLDFIFIDCGEVVEKPEEKDGFEWAGLV